MKYLAILFAAAVLLLAAVIARPAPSNATSQDAVLIQLKRIETRLITLNRTLELGGDRAYTKIDNIDRKLGSGGYGNVGELLYKIWLNTRP